MLRRTVVPPTLLVLLAGCIVPWLVPLAAAQPPVHDDAAQPPVHDDATLVARDGWRYEHVRVSLTEDGEAIRVERPDGAVRIFAFAEVLRVESATGEDVTERLIPLPVRGPREDRRAPPEGTARRGAVPGLGEIGGSAEPAATGRRGAVRRARPFDATFGAGIGLGFPNGQWYEGLDNDLALHGLLRVALSERTHVTLGYRRQNLGGGSELLEQFGTFEYDVRLNEIVIMIGMHGAPADPRRPIGYLEGGLASADHVVAVVHDGHEVSDSEGRAVIVAQGGVMIPVSGYLAVEFGANLLWKASFLDGDHESESDGTIVGVHAGLTLLVGGDLER